MINKFTFFYYPCWFVIVHLYNFVLYYILYSYISTELKFNSIKIANKKSIDSKFETTVKENRRNDGDTKYAPKLKNYWSKKPVKNYLIKVMKKVII